MPYAYLCTLTQTQWDLSSYVYGRWLLPIGVAVCEPLNAAAAPSFTITKITVCLCGLRRVQHYSQLKEIIFLFFFFFFCLSCVARRVCLLVCVPAPCDCVRFAVTASKWSLLVWSMWWAHPALYEFACRQFSHDGLQLNWSQQINEMCQADDARCRRGERTRKYGSPVFFSLSLCISVFL